MKTILLALLFAIGASTSAPAESIGRLFANSPDAVTLEFVKNNTGPVDQKDAEECTALHYAAVNGRIETARWLIAHHADVNTTAYNQFTPMHVVRDAGLARLLIQAGADLKRKDAFGFTPLQKAARNESRDVCEVILATGFPLDLSSALLLGKRDAAIRMIQAHPEVVKTVEQVSSFDGNVTPLGLAVTQGDLEMVKLLLKAGAPVDATTDQPLAGNVTALCNAVWTGEYEIAELLCAAGADCNVIGGKLYPQLLDYALEQSDKKMVALLVKYGAKARDEHPPKNRRDHPSAALFINNHLYGDKNGCQTDLLVSGGMRCGHPGHVSEVTWEFLRTSPDGDLYKFTRYYPAGATPSSVESKEITFSGKPLTLWSDDFQKILLQPKPVR